MSHLISTYAGATGLKVASPFLLSKFVAIPYDRYITVQTGSGQAAKNYGLWQEVIALIGPTLASHQIAIVHLGAREDPALQGVHDLRGRTDVHQAQYAIQKALLHMGNDSWLVHCAGWNEKPLVALYGSTSAANHGPYWYNKDKTILISSHRGGGKPTFSNPENPKTIDWIPPEEVSDSVLSLLGLPERIAQSSRFFGLLYQNALFDQIPDHVVDPKVLPDVPFTIRMDYLFDQDKLAQILGSGRKVNIITNQPIELGLIARFKDQILSYSHELDETCPVMYVARIPSLIKHASFYTKGVDEAKVASLRFRFFDITFIQQMGNVCKRDYLNAALLFKGWGEDRIPELESEIQGGQLGFKTNKYILGSGKMYLSTYHWKKGVSTSSLSDNRGDVVDNPDFWVDANHMTIFKRL